MLIIKHDRWHAGMVRFFIRNRIQTGGHFQIMINGSVCFRVTGTLPF